MKIRRAVCLGAVSIMMLGLLAACGQQEESWSPVSPDNKIRIAIIGDEEYIADNGAMEAMEMASDDFYEKTGVRIETVIFNDNSDYNQGIECAKKIAADESITVVLVKQELDYIDATAEIFDEAGKPFILTNGCYESTIDKSYSYMLVDCINAKAAGSIMGEYVMEHGYQTVAFCHSDTTYEEDELKGFQAEIEGKGACFADTVVGPYSQEEFNQAYTRWLDLGIDVVCISNYDILNSDLVRMLREKGSDIQVVGDYVMDTDEDIEANGKYLDGTAIVAMYINDSNENDQEIMGRFEDIYKMEMSEKAIQSYDITYMLGEELTSGISNAKELIENIKASEGYDGISGTLQFDERGCLIPNGNEVLVFENGTFAQN